MPARAPLRRRRVGASAQLLVTLSPAVLDRLRDATADGNRSAFVEDAIAAALEREGRPPTGAERARRVADQVDHAARILRELAAAMED